MHQRSIARGVVVALFVSALSCLATAATIFASVHGIIHDQQHRPIPGAQITLRSVTSDWSQETKTNDEGEFTFTTVPIGDYRVLVRQKGFGDSEQAVTVVSGASPVLHFSLSVATVKETVNVSAKSAI